VGLAAKVKETPLGQIPFPLPLVLPVPADDRTYEKRGGFQLAPSGTAIVSVTIPMERTLVVQRFEVSGADLFSQENLRVEVLTDGIAVNPIGDLQRVPAPVAFFETFLPINFLVTARQSNRELGLRLTNASAFGFIHGSWQILAFLTKLGHVEGSI
jgi:hypothetical protein